MADYSKAYTCTPRNSCVPCDTSELNLAYCVSGKGYKQEVACEWNGGVPKEYQDTHSLPEYIACTSLVDVDRTRFFHYLMMFVALGVLAFAMYGWRRKRVLAQYSNL